MSLMFYTDYYATYGDKDCYYVVTLFGCNSTANDMWIPITYLFSNFEKAYACYLNNKPDENDRDNYAEKYTPLFDPIEYSKPGASFVIESCKQTAGYHACAFDGERSEYSYAKRPYGAVITRCSITAEPFLQ